MDDFFQRSPIGIIGAGLMGTGIASVFAAAGRDVILFDEDPGRLKEVHNRIADIGKELAHAGLVEGHIQDLTHHVQTSDTISGLGGTHFLIEAIPEIPELKQSLYARLESVIASSAILTSNTSGLMPSKLAEKLKHPERFLVAHFWNPPHAIPLVEIVPSPSSQKKAVDSTIHLLEAIGMEPVLVEREIPGFIGNRLQYAVLREALAIVRSGAASPEAVDRVMKSSLGRRYATVGPIETADLGGLDTFLTIASHLMPELAKDEDVLQLIKAKVDAGNTGVRTGQGFYQWSPERALSVIGNRNADLLRRRVVDKGLRTTRAHRKNGE
jgi:3-hydroxybutyryl-CoA dehydrogenase